jgi:uncharacterized protein YdhG (YjbR/CyaY superfamily)
MITTKAVSVDEYMAKYPNDVQSIMEQVRDTIKKAAPNSEEVISYSMPAFRQNGILVYFGGFKNHLGFFPTAKGVEAFKKELSAYKGAKGSIQFPYDKPMPLDLISRIVKFRAKQDSEKTKAKKK